MVGPGQHLRVRTPLSTSSTCHSVRPARFDLRPSIPTSKPTTPQVRAVDQWQFAPDRRQLAGNWRRSAVTLSVQRGAVHQPPRRSCARMRQGNRDCSLRVGPKGGIENTAEAPPRTPVRPLNIKGLKALLLSQLLDSVTHKPQAGALSAARTQCDYLGVWPY